jgi:hypothetical protein
LIRVKGRQLQGQAIALLHNGEVQAQLSYNHELSSWRSSYALLLIDPNLFLGYFMKILLLSSRYVTCNNLRQFIFLVII